MNSWDGDEVFILDLAWAIIDDWYVGQLPFGTFLANFSFRAIGKEDTRAMLDVKDLKWIDRLMGKKRSELFNRPSLNLNALEIVIAQLVD